jgi:hypothetical protein
MKRFAFLAVVACLGVCALAGTGRAESITYTMKATGSGSLNGTPFTDAPVTLTLSGDTANVMGIGQSFLITGTATVTVAGVTDTFKDPITVVVDQSGGQAGFFDGLAILNTFNSAFNSYDLKTPIGPVTGGASGNAGNMVPLTPGGSFVWGAGGVPGTSTFTATTQTTTAPEPASLTLLGVGAVDLAGYGWRKRRRAAA